MKFSLGVKNTRKGVTPRRVAAAKRVIQKRADKFPLFADQFKAEESPLDRINEADDRAEALFQQLRDSGAKHWRQGRSILFALPYEDRMRLLEAWDRSPVPKTAEYFADFIWMQGHGVNHIGETYQEVCKRSISNAAPWMQYMLKIGEKFAASTN